MKKTPLIMFILKALNSVTLILENAGKQTVRRTEILMDELHSSPAVCNFKSPYLTVLNHNNMSLFYPDQVLTRGRLFFGKGKDLFEQKLFKVKFI